MKRELKVYSVNDMDWWVTDTLDNLKIAYEEQTGEEIDEDVLEECDLDKEGMYWSFEDIPEMQIVIKIIMEQIGNDENYVTAKMDEEEYSFSYCDTYGMYVSFRRALELDSPYEKPHLLSTTPY